VGYKRKARIVFLAREADCPVMAQEFCRCTGNEWIEARAASLDAAPLAPQVIEVMAESGCPTTASGAEPFTDALLGWADLVVTMDAAAERMCASVPQGVQKRHYPFDVPGSVGRDSDLRRDAYRTLRDGIRARIGGMAGGIRLLQRAAEE
jgi:protein-tyrosine-phosphatase